MSNQQEVFLVIDSVDWCDQWEPENDVRCLLIGFIIMAHPKRRQSKTRTLKRRTHDKAVAPTLAVCPNCGAYYVYHTVCPTCGYYRGKVAIVKETAE